MHIAPLVVVLVSLNLLTPGCAERPAVPSYAVHNDPALSSKERIAAALRDLLDCNIMHFSCFITLTQRDTDKWIQFTGDKDAVLMINLGLGPGDNAEDRAVYQSLADALNRPFDSEDMMHVSLDRDVDEATGAAIEAFRIIHGVDPDDLDVAIEFM